MRRLLLVLFLFAGCKDDPLPSYETYQDCFDDVTDNLDLEVVPAIVRCCTRHPIEGEIEACGDTMPDCVNYLTDNLAQVDADIGQLMEACEMVEDMLEGP